MSDLIYLDHNATSPIHPAAADAMREASLQYAGNPGSQHAYGRKARRALEDARERFAELVGAKTGGTSPDRVIFTSGGTEANNLALFGMLGPPGQPVADRSQLITSAIEHPSILEPSKRLKSTGLPNQQNWRRQRWRHPSRSIQANSPRLNTQLVSLMLANNETGVVQPIAEISHICATQNIPIHCDAAQAVGKMPVDFAGLNLAMMSCCCPQISGSFGDRGPRRSL